jgi:hypothetical protein
MNTDGKIKQAAEIIHFADALLVTTGAGMGVDSDLEGIPRICECLV